MAKEKKGFIKEFKEFAISGNMFDMAIGIIIGGVFKDLVASFTENIIMPIISIFTGGVDFTSWKVQLPSIFNKTIEVSKEDGTVVTEQAKNYLNYGNFISAIISFLILMLVVFLMVKGVNKIRKAAEAKKAKEEEKKEEAPPEPTKEEKLLTEIRDLLAKK
ncbi:MAG: large conductance mechanosensitive channel protein MscL [Oscillospiraceae bacterium]|nr:large conductance mechanosensitive channel protein MscL [Oscillospiraceae bacterium]